MLRKLVISVVFIGLQWHAFCYAAGLAEYAHLLDEYALVKETECNEMEENIYENGNNTYHRGTAALLRDTRTVVVRKVLSGSFHAVVISRRLVNFGLIESLDRVEIVTREFRNYGTIKGQTIIIVAQQCGYTQVCTVNNLGKIKPKLDNATFTINLNGIDVTDEYLAL